MGGQDIPVRNQDLLSQADVLLSSCLDYEATIQKVLEVAVPRLADWCVVDVIDDEGRVQRVAAAHTDPSKAELIQQIRNKYLASPKATRGVYRVIETGRSILISEPDEESLRRRADDSEHLRIIRELGHKSYMCVPLIARGRTIGTILLCSAQRIFGEADLRLAESFAGRFALAVDNARLYREARDAVRIRDEFLSIAAHELRTPLTVLSFHGSAIDKAMNSLASRTDLTEELVRLKKAVEVSDQEVRRISRLVNVLMDLSNLHCRKLVLNPGKVDLLELVRDAIRRFHAQIQASGSSLEWIEQSSAIGKWDQIRLEQVIDNLISNAIKYAAGRVIRISVSSREGFGVFRIEDEGCGISPQDLQRIFKPFERGGNESLHSGLGLGLYICRMIVEAHSGTITAKSQPAVGSAFEVKLPLTEVGH